MNFAGRGEMISINKPDILPGFIADAAMIVFFVTAPVALAASVTAAIRIFVT